MDRSEEEKIRWGVYERQGGKGGNQTRELMTFLALLSFSRTGLPVDQRETTTVQLTERTRLILKQEVAESSSQTCGKESWRKRGGKRKEERFWPTMRKVPVLRGSETTLAER